MNFKAMAEISEFVEFYREFRKHRPMTKRERLRFIALEVLSRMPKKHVDNSEGSVVFLAYHFLFKDNVELFRELVSFLADKYNFLTVSSAIEQLRSNRLKGENICFTCDDGFASNVKAAEIMNEFGASCCFFICPSFIEDRTIQTIAEVNKERLGGPPIEFMTWEQIDGLLEIGEHEIGNHTWGHENLGLVSFEDASYQVEQADMVLRKRYGDIKHFACPYGYPDAYTPHVVQCVEELGYKSFFTTTRGRHVNNEAADGIMYKRHHFEPFWPVRQSYYFLNNY